MLIFIIVSGFVADMINMMKLEYVPLCCEWIHCPGDAIAALAV
jgi:peptidylprolyl isomerase domain and WD repeat-containing protein 1